MFLPVSSAFFKFLCLLYVWLISSFCDQTKNIWQNSSSCSFLHLIVPPPPRVLGPLWITEFNACTKPRILLAASLWSLLPLTSLPLLSWYLPTIHPCFQLWRE
jgi:hypothetical protein